MKLKHPEQDGDDAENVIAMMSRRGEGEGAPVPMLTRFLEHRPAFQRFQAVCCVGSVTKPHCDNPTYDKISLPPETTQGLSDHITWSLPRCQRQYYTYVYPKGNDDWQAVTRIYLSGLYAGFNLYVYPYLAFTRFDRRTDRSDRL